MSADLPFLDLANPNFSVRSAEVKAAREKGAFARTPYGLAVLRYDEVGVLLKDQRLRQGSYKWPALNGATGSFADWWVRMLLNRVGDDHARLRRLANPAFAPKLILAMQPRFTEIANDLIGRFAQRGKAEFMAEFAEPYATRVVCELIGLPDHEWRELADIAAGMGLALGVNYPADQAEANAATDKMFAYSRRLIAARKSDPRGDFISLLIEANTDKEKLSDLEMEDTLVVTIFGGIDTTRNQLGLAIATFAEHPEQWQRLAAEPELARAAIEEVMRIRPTITWVSREALEDFTIGEQAITKGTTLHLFSEAAGTDPRVFAEGFDIGVKRKPHYGFGAGPHHCPGHAIARGDMTEALKILARRLPDLRIAEGATWLPDSGNTGPITLPIEFRL